MIGTTCPRGSTTRRACCSATSPSPMRRSSRSSTTTTSSRTRSSAANSASIPMRWCFHNQDGVDSNRLIVESNWRRQMIDGIGQVFTPFAQLRGDIYGVGGVDNQGLNGSPDFVSETPDNGAILRGNALGGIEYRYPWMASTGSVTHVFEPIGQIIVRPNSLGNQQDIPNEDALSLVFDDTLLFDIDKFSGYDRIETGTRANVGMRYTAQLASGTYARAVFGESYQLAGAERIRHGLLPVERPRHRPLRLCRRPLHSGPVQSRLLGAVALRREYLGHQAHRSRHLCALRAGAAEGELCRRHRRTRAGPRPATRGNCHGRRPGAHRGLVSARQYPLRPRDLDQTITDGLGLRYQDDCFTADVTYQRSFIQDQDIEPDQRFLVNFALKYLGTYQVATEATAACSARAVPTPTIRRWRRMSERVRHCCGVECTGSRVPRSGCLDRGSPARPLPRRQAPIAARRRKCRSRCWSTTIRSPTTTSISASAFSPSPPSAALARVEEESDRHADRGASANAGGPRKSASSPDDDDVNKILGDMAKKNNLDR